tara:strand:- start:786 stop:902 length:117 start_codon:yes stop_codon:yes gene_type:complete
LNNSSLKNNIINNDVEAITKSGMNGPVNKKIGIKGKII